MKRDQLAKASVSLMVGLASLLAALLVNWVSALLGVTGILLLQLAYSERVRVQDESVEQEREECEVCAYWREHGVVIDHGNHPTVRLPEVLEVKNGRR